MNTLLISVSRFIKGVISHMDSLNTVYSTLGVLKYISNYNSEHHNTGQCAHLITHPILNNTASGLYVSTLSHPSENSHFAVSDLNINKFIMCTFQIALNSTQLFCEIVWNQ